MKQAIVGAILTVLLTSCEQGGAVLPSAELPPSESAAHKDIPITLTIKGSFSKFPAYEACWKILGSLKFDSIKLTHTPENQSTSAQWIFEGLKAINPPLQDADLFLNAVKASACGSQNSISWAVSQKFKP